MSITMTETTTFTVCPFADIDLDHETDGSTIDALLTALERDPRAIAPAVGYDHVTHRVDAIFQVQDDVTTGLDRQLASAGAFEIFDAALAAAGLDVRTVGLSIVEGDDPDLLP
jgi:hypothetical protein